MVAFFLKYNGYNVKVTLAFALGFDGKRAIVGDLELTVSEDSIVHATELPHDGERWFKSKQVGLHS